MTIAEYWSWWDDARDEVEAAIEERETDAPVLRELLDRVSALGLACELSPGRTARHAVCVSANGDPSLRKLAYRWWDLAPAADATFEYHPARIAGSPDAVLMLGGERFAFADLRFAIALDEARRELGLGVQHPAFAGLDEQARAQIGFIALDNILGEEDVERWIGALEWSGAAPTASAGPQDLQAEIERLRETEGSDEWALLRTEEAVAVAARPLRPVDHPYFDLLCELKARPVDHDLSVLQKNETTLARDFGHRAFHAASLTQGDIRTAFVYVDADEPTSGELEAWAARRGYETVFSLDPAWDAVRRFR
jgi:hypothetical protein